MSTLISDASAPPASPSSPAAPVRLRLHYLDGLRGLAALYVVLHHAYYGLTSEMTLSHLAALLTYWLFLGRSAVDIFIVLSGYCLMMPVSRAGSDGLPSGLAEFFRRRARRILPPYYAAMALALVGIVALPALHDLSHPDALWNEALPAFSPGVIVSHLLLIHNFDPGWHSKIDYPMWSVATEWQIYFLFPLLLLPVRRRLGTTAAVLAAFLVGLVPLALFFNRFSGVCPHFLGLFALGMAASDLNFSTRPGLARWRERLPWGGLAAALGSALVLVSLRHSDWFLFVAAKDIVVGAATACLLVFCTRHLTRALETDGLPSGHAPLVLRLMESRAAVGLGAFSYSLYLVHAPVLAVCQSVLRPLALSPTVSLALMLGVAVPLALLCSYVFHLAFERPFLNRAGGAAGRRPFRRSGNAEAAAPGR